MELSPEGIVAYVTSYIGTLPADIMRGDVFALTITLIAFFIAVVLINRLTGLLIVFLKKAILFIIVALAFWQFILMFFARVSREGLTNDTLIFGTAGLIIGIVAISISLFVALRSYHESRGGTGTSVTYTSSDAPAEPKTTPSLMPGIPTNALQSQGGLTVMSTSVTQEPAKSAESSTISSIRETLSVNNLRSDKSLGAVLAYLVIAQFGVFSSKTMPAPSFQIGIAFFVFFIIAALVFIHFTYNNYLTGLRHLFMAVVIGTIIALVLGYFWGNIPLDVLLSPAFFQTDALVALVTGLALSLFMGGKG